MNRLLICSLPFSINPFPLSFTTYLTFACMNKDSDIKTLDDIKLLVNQFYGKVREDELLAPVFEARIGNKWPEHLEKMYSFWQTILLEENTYRGRPFPPHATLDIDRRHFEKWVELFKQTIEENFEGEKAENAKWRADKMSELFQLKKGLFNIG